MKAAYRRTNEIWGQAMPEFIDYLHKDAKFLEAVQEMIAGEVEQKNIEQSTTTARLAYEATIDIDFDEARFQQEVEEAKAYLLDPNQSASFYIERFS